MNYSKKTYLVIIISIILIIMVLHLLQSIKQPTKNNVNSFLTPTTFQTTASPTPFQVFSPPEIETIPTFPPSKGTGVDINSNPVKTSASEIQKLLPSLPYDQKYTPSTSIGVSVIIPKQTLQPWVLSIRIIGINYEVLPTDQNFSLMKSSFREASDKVFSWIKEHDVDPNKIYIDWGNKSYVQNQAENWLK